MRNQGRWLWLFGGVVAVGALVWAFSGQRPADGYLVALLITPCQPNCVLERLESAVVPTIREARLTAELWVTSLIHEDAFVLVVGPDDRVVSAWNTAPAVEKTGADLQRAVSDLEQDLNMKITREAIAALPAPEGMVYA